MGANLGHFSKKNEMRGTVLEQIKGLNAGMKTDGESVSSSCSGQSKEEPRRASESKEGSHCIIDIDIMMGGGRSVTVMIICITKQRSLWGLGLLDVL